MRTTSLAELPTKWEPKDTAQMTTRTFSFEIITPMFGGHTESWKINETHPVRAQGIKGQLRFWWRTMQTESDSTKLLHRENKLWGGKFNAKERKKSDVSIAVQIKSKPDIHEASIDSQYQKIIPLCVCFPITESISKGSTVSFVTQCKFDLQVTYPTDREIDVLNTLKLWTLFGGVGARTRRGTGALFCDALLTNFTDAQSIKDFITQLYPRGTQCPDNAEYPQLRGCIFAAHQAAPNSDTQAVWRNLLSDYGTYRQARPAVSTRPLNNGERPHPGRSYWPEPDTIRRITGKHYVGPVINHAPVHPDGNWFPRAAFGLPIQTEFRSNNSPGDPTGKFNLMPFEHERWPSPVVLKVIRLPNNSVLKTALILNHQIPRSLVLKGNNLPLPVTPNANNRNYILRSTEMPLYTSQPNTEPSLNRQMRTDKPLIAGESVYQHLIRNLNLQEVV
jgi:CRISPR-associated protein Cmr1